jgi:hypothetical protein
MPAIIDPIAFSIRGGDDAKEFGDYYTCSGLVLIQRDRSALIEGFAGEFSPADYRDAIGQLRELGLRYRWKEILWDRMADGLMRPVRIPIVPKGAIP